MASVIVTIASSWHLLLWTSPLNGICYCDHRLLMASMYIISNSFRVNVSDKILIQSCRIKQSLLYLKSMSAVTFDHRGLLQCCNGVQQWHTLYCLLVLIPVIQNASQIYGIQVCKMHCTNSCCHWTAQSSSGLRLYSLQPLRFIFTQAVRPGCTVSGCTDFFNLYLYSILKRRSVYLLFVGGLRFIRVCAFCSLC